MKKVRFLMSVLVLSLAVGACSTSLTAPECEDPDGCFIAPGPNN